MNGASNTDFYKTRMGPLLAPELDPKALKGGKDLCVKPRVRPMADGTFLVTLTCGTTSMICQVPAQYGSGTEYTVDGVSWCGELQRFSSFEDAVRAAGRRSKLELEPIPSTAEQWRTLAAEVDRDVDAACKVLRKLLRERTGRDWSVTRGRGTAYCWIRIHAPPKRRCKFGYLSIEDQILLSAALGGDRSVSEQGESIRTERGVRGSYVFRIAGVEVPNDWQISSPSWD